MKVRLKRLLCNVAVIVGATPLLIWALVMGATAVEGKIIPGMAIGFSDLFIMLAEVVIGYSIAVVIALPARLYGARLSRAHPELPQRSTRVAGAILNAAMLAPVPVFVIAFIPITFVT
jgi:hypothetical protein